MVITPGHLLGGKRHSVESKEIFYGTHNISIITYHFLACLDKHFSHVEYSETPDLIKKNK